MDRLRATSENHGVARLETQRRCLDGHVRSRFVDHANNAQRDSHATHINPGGHAAHIGNVTDGFG